MPERQWNGLHSFCVKCKENWNGSPCPLLCISQIAAGVNWPLWYVLVLFWPPKSEHFLLNEATRKRKKKTRAKCNEMTLIASADYLLFRQIGGKKSAEEKCFYDDQTLKIIVRSRLWRYRWLVLASFYVLVTSRCGHLAWIYYTPFGFFNEIFKILINCCSTAPRNRGHRRWVPWRRLATLDAVAWRRWAGAAMECLHRTAKAAAWTSLTKMHPIHVIRFHLARRRCWRMKVERAMRNHSATEPPLMEASSTGNGPKRTHSRSHLLWQQIPVN